MLTKGAMKRKIEEVSHNLIIYKDLYRQAADSRDFWNNEAKRFRDKVNLAKNKLRDEIELSDHLAEHLRHMVTNHNSLTPADITKGHFLLKVYKEARNDR